MQVPAALVDAAAAAAAIVVEKEPASAPRVTVDERPKAEGLAGTNPRAVEDGSEAAVEAAIVGGIGESLKNPR